MVELSPTGAVTQEVIDAKDLDYPSYPLPEVEHLALTNGNYSVVLSNTWVARARHPTNMQEKPAVFVQVTSESADKPIHDVRVLLKYSTRIYRYDGDHLYQAPFYPAHTRRNFTDADNYRVIERYPDDSVKIYQSYHAWHFYRTLEEISSIYLTGGIRVRVFYGTGEDDYEDLNFGWQFVRPSRSSVAGLPLATLANEPPDEAEGSNERLDPTAEDEMGE